MPRNINPVSTNLPSEMPANTLQAALLQIERNILAEVRKSRDLFVTARQNSESVKLIVQYVVPASLKGVGRIELTDLIDRKLTIAGLQDICIISKIPKKIDEPIVLNIIFKYSSCSLNYSDSFARMIIDALCEDILLPQFTYSDCDSPDRASEGTMVTSPTTCTASPGSFYMASARRTAATIIPSVCVSDVSLIEEFRSGGSSAHP